jgi:methionyl-tRNA synthetase
VRFFRRQNGQENVFFITGTDEYGTTNEKAAEKAGKEPYEYVREISEKNREQLKALNISYDRFIETTDKDHHEVVDAIWTRVFNNGDIYKGTYVGLYCEGCESYKTMTELIDGKCEFHPTREIKKLEEENYFFRWSKYQEFLVDLITTQDDFVIPEGRKNEMLSFVKNGLEDLPISRPAYKVGWGIPVPGDEKDQRIYVWFDALISYYTAAITNGFWKDDTRIIHTLGKDNARWHVLLWPAMLKSAGLRLPDNILTHGFINLNGQKISKSLGNIIRPTEVVAQYGADAVRYILLKYGPERDDIDITFDKIKHVYNSELANDWGNLVSRVAKLCENNGIEGKREALQFSPEVIKEIENFSPSKALTYISEYIAKINLSLNQDKPWEKEGDEVKKLLEKAASQVRQIAYDFLPFMPETSEKILKQFSHEKIVSTTPYFLRIK